MKYSGHRKLLCELPKSSKLNAFILLGYQSNTDASILVYKHRPERTGFNMYAENTQQQLNFLALLPCNLKSFFVEFITKSFPAVQLCPGVNISYNVIIYQSSKNIQKIIFKLFILKIWVPTFSRLETEMAPKDLFKTCLSERR